MLLLLYVISRHQHALQPVRLFCRQNQALERDWQSMLDEKFRLQQESKALSEHLNALLKEKFGLQEDKGFDSDTPIDKALTFLQFIIAVCYSHVSAPSPYSSSYLRRGHGGFRCMRMSQTTVDQTSHLQLQLTLVHCQAVPVHPCTCPCRHSFSMFTVSSPVW